MHVFLIAGEPSGDAIGGRLMAALRRRLGNAVRFSGVGGPQMEAEGLESLFSYTELAVMGVVEILPRAPTLLRRMSEAARAITRELPDVLVTIDAPAFAFGVVKRLPDRTVPRVHYVAPTIWAWRPWRLHKYKRAFDHILALFPFEPKLFVAGGLPCTFVGHPVVERGVGEADGGAFRAQHGIPDDAMVLCLLPGSRRGEVSRLLRPFGGAARRLAERHHGLRVVVPTLPHVAPSVWQAAAGWPMQTIVVDAVGDRFAAMAASNVAIAASGTVALELALARVPTVIGYRVTLATALVLWAMLRVKHVSIVNLLAGREVLPELLQGRCRPDLLADAVENLLAVPVRRQDVLDAQAAAMLALGLGGDPPSDRAAAAICDIIAQRSLRPSVPALES